MFSVRDSAVARESVQGKSVFCFSIFIFSLIFWHFYMPSLVLRVPSKKVQQFCVSLLHCSYSHHAQYFSCVLQTPLHFISISIRRCRLISSTDCRMLAQWTANEASQSARELAAFLKELDSNEIQMFLTFPLRSFAIASFGLCDWLLGVFGLGWA